MVAFNSILNDYLSGYMFLRRKETDPRIAYDLWAAHYDEQPGNLMLALEEEIFSSLVGRISLEEKRVIDIGCGTGRHWKEMLDQHPARLTGYDVSEGMLQQLRQRYPLAEAYQISRDTHLPQLEDGSCDIIISTLAIAHIRYMEQALGEWNRVLKRGGKIIITDYHPAALAKGGDRTFRHKGRLVAIKNYVHPVEKIRGMAGHLNWEMITFIERVIDSRVRHFYEKQAALMVFERFQGVPIVYGMYLKKKDALA